MKVNELEIGGIYQLPVDNCVGYAEYCYTGQTHPNPNGGLDYCFQGRAWCGEGYYWFEIAEIEQMSYIETDWWYKMMHDIEVERNKKKENV